MTMNLIRDVLSDDVLSSIGKPTAEATGLPNHCYTDAGWLSLENAHLFGRTWMLAGFQHDVPGKGDVCPVEVAGVPLLLLRDDEDSLQVFHNVCRHRGAILVPEACKARKLLTCPYHAWAYGLDGKLRTRPHFHGGGRHDTDPGPDAPGLVPVRSAVWNDLVFVDLSGEAPEFEQHWKPFSKRTQAYDFSVLRHASSLRFEIQANWKLVYENFFDPYHVPAVHPKLEAFTAITERPATSVEGPWFFATVQIPELEEGRGLGMPHYPGLDAYTAHTEWYFHLFPTTCIQIWPDQMAVFQLHAEAPDRTIEYIHLYFVGEGAEDPALAQQRQDVYEMWTELNTEDFRIVENMQRARSSPGFDGGAFSPFWDPATRHFADLVAEAMS